MSNNDEHNYFSVAAAVASLSESARLHDKQSIVTAGSLLDMSPALLLRGLAILSECLEASEEVPPMQASIARTTIREITALCAELLDIGCLADILSSDKLGLNKQDAAAHCDGTQSV